jgi:hypothetical protein
MTQTGTFESTTTTAPQLNGTEIVYAVWGKDRFSDKWTVFETTDALTAEDWADRRAFVLPEAGTDKVVRDYVRRVA